MVRTSGTVAALAVLCAAACGGDEPRRDMNFIPGTIMDPVAGTGAGAMSSPAPTPGVDAGAPPPAPEDAASPVCAHAGPPVRGVSGLALCPACTSGHCLSPSEVPDAVADLVEDCEEGSACVPDVVIETGGKFVLDACKSIDGADGRCASRCFPAVRALAGVLPEAECGPDELCMPCFDPSSGTDTGFCGLSCDAKGATGEPVVLPPCCAAANGVCRPASGFEADQVLFSQGDCADADRVCVPAALSDAASAPLATCTSFMGAEGRCAPECLGLAGLFGTALPKDTCADGDLCAPCFHPTDGAATGLCDIAGDAPTQPAILYEKCCPHTPPGGVSMNLASCVPLEAIPDAWEKTLRQETCPVNHMCLQDTSSKNLIYDPPLCQTDGSFGVSLEGVCVNDCFVHGIEQQASPQSTCVEEKRCAPCRDPGKQPTGVCPHDQPP